MPRSALNVKDGVRKDMQRLKHRITLSECLHAVPLATAADGTMQVPAQLTARTPSLKQALRVFLPQGLLRSHGNLLACLESQQG